METTFVILKPDCVHRGLIGEVISRIERKSLRIVAMRMTVFSEEKAKQHYKAHASKPFFDELIRYITSGPVVVLAVKGVSAVSVMRNLAGATDGSTAVPGTIRGDFAADITQNIIHTADSVASAKVELDHFFGQILSGLSNER